MFHSKRILSFLSYICIVLAVCCTTARAQMQILGPVSVTGNSSQCYSTRTDTYNCSPTGFCWTVTNGTTSSSQCGGGEVFAALAAPVPPPGSCSDYPSTSVTFADVDVVTSATVQVNDNCGHSKTITVTVNPRLKNVVISPGLLNAYVGQQPGTFTTNTPTGGNGTYTYQWQVSANNTSWTNVSGATAKNYSPAIPTAAGVLYYRVLVSSGAETFTTASASLNSGVYATLDGGTAYPDADAIYPGTSTAFFYGTQATGGIGTYTYQWQGSTDGGAHWFNRTEATATALYMIPPVQTVTTWYRRMVSDGVSQAYTNVFAVNVFPPLSDAGTITATANTCFSGGSPGSITGTTPTGGIGGYNYQWQSSADGNSWTNVSGATAAAYTPVNLTTNIYFRRQVNCDGTLLASNSVLINVYQPLRVAINPGGVVYIEPGNSLPTFAVWQVSGGDGSYTYQWQVSVDGSNWTNITGANAGSYTPAAITANSLIRLQVNDLGSYVYSAVASIIYPLSGGTIQASAGTVAPNGNITLSSVQAPSNDRCEGNYIIIWQSSTDQANWSDQLSASYSGLTQPTWFRRMAKCGINTAYSNTVFVGIGQVAQGHLPTTETGASAGSGTAYLPAASPMATPQHFNAIQTRDFLKPGILDLNTADGQTALTDMHQATAYFDGLGRAAQQVSWHEGAGETDIVTPVIYDEYGRETHKFLPYANGTDGNYKTDAFTSQANFYKSSYAAQQPALTGEHFFYSKTVVEASPLARPLKSLQAGNSWVGSERGVQQQYMTNTAAGDNVRVWTIANDAAIQDDINIPVAGNAYADGTLYKNVTLDENGNAVVEYKDFDDHVILKKVQNGAVNADFSGYTNWLCTYYIYDDLNQLRFVIPPKAVNAAIGANWILQQDVVNELCFRYAYDARQRMIAKKVPGAGWVYMVYDVRDRLVYTQDANMRQNSNAWMETVYDDRNRVIQSGMLQGYTGDRAALQQTLTGLVNVAANLVVSQYQTGQTLYQASNSIEFTDGFATPAGVEITGEIINSDVTNPAPGSGNFVPLIYTYYDNYEWTQKNLVTAYNTLLPAGNSLYAETVPGARNEMLNGVVTGKRVRVLEDPNNLEAGKWLESVNFPDEKGRMTQVQQENYKGGLDVVTSRYDFSGKVLSSYLVHNNPAGNINNHRVLTQFSYDNYGRQTVIAKTINDNGQPRIIAVNNYDLLGKLQTKQLGQKLDNNGQTLPNQYLEQQDYAYSIRGWLKGLNWKDYGQTKTSAIDQRWFAMDLSYDYGYQSPAFNGNISGARWKTQGDPQERSFGYGYDNVNRLLSAEFKQYDAGNASWGNPGGIDFSVKMGDGLTATSAYDENGNILAMQQNGFSKMAYQSIDQLSYAYTGNSNKLSSVADAANTTGAKLGDFQDGNTTGADYSYDVNGNLVQDKNKQLAGIVYNHLNLPWQITANTDDNSSVKGTIKYLYDAEGNKLVKQVNEAASAANGNTAKQTITDYAGGFVYENNLLQFFGQEEGRIRPQLNTDGSVKGYAFDYFLKDHLGNTRVVLTDEKQQDIYPAATLEGDATNGALAVEKNYYSIDENNIVSRPSGVPDYANNNGIANNNPNSQTTANSAKMFKLTGGGASATGLGITLKVMSGDVIDIFGKSYYNTGNPGGNTGIPTESILSGLLGTPGGTQAAAAHGVTAAGLNAIPSAISEIQLLQADQTTASNASSTTPKAFINYLFFDERFNCVGHGFSMVGGNGTLKDHYSELQSRKAPANGYVYVYCSNESPVAVYFDNLQVVLNHGPLLEETHYYPFGLTMAGISSKAEGKVENRYKYNGIEYDSSLGLNEYEAHYRDLDPQIARWWQVDPKIDDMEMWSPYASNYNNPVSYSDNLGDWPDWLDKAAQVGKKIISEGATGLLGVANAYSSDNVGGVGRVDGSNLSGGAGTAFRFGQKVGDVLALATGGVEALGGTLATVASGGTLSLASVTVALHGGLTGTVAVKNLINNNVHSEGASDQSAQQSSKSKNKPNESGTPNSSKIEGKDASGKTTKYSTYDENGNIVKQVESDRGVDRHGVQGATKKVPTYNTLPNGTVKQGKYKIEPATPVETPPGNNTRL
ncbi:DUF6443 domain-containing protein [Deminuibacter soli]|nr:DUF6443 domain-containing protein [Deminuibacter soli]